MREEDRLQTSCVDYLRMRLPESYRFFHVPNGFFVPGASRQAVAREMGKLKAMGLSNGVPDLIILGPRFEVSHALFAELKTGKGSLTREQREWGAFLEGMHWPYAVCRSPEDLEDFLDRNSVPARARLRAKQEA